MTSDRFIRNKRGVGEVRSADTHLSLVVGTHVQVAQDGLGADFLIKFLIGGSIISWPKIQLKDEVNRLCGGLGGEWSDTYLMELVASLGMSRKQKIAKAEVIC